MTRRRMVAAGSKSKNLFSATSRHYDKRSTAEKMKEIFPLPEPRNKGIIKKIIGPKGENLRRMEKKVKIKPYDIRQKKNEVHIIGTREQVEEVKSFLEKIIEEELKQQEESKNDEVVPLPPEKIGLIMGNKGNRILKIEMETSTSIKVKEKAAYIKGSSRNKLRAARKIQDIIEKSTSEGKIKVSLPADCKLGHVVGQQCSTLKRLEEETGACIELIEDAIYVSGEDSDCKKAIVKIKSKAAEVCQNKKILKQFNFLHASEQSGDYKLKAYDCPNPSWNGEKHFKVYRIDENKKSHDIDHELDTKELQEFLCKTLKEVQEECKNQEVKAELFCHFGHLYIGNVDEEDQKGTYNLSQLKKELLVRKDKNHWRLRFDPAIEELEFKHLENTLKDINDGSCTTDPLIRHDFQFLTPDCTTIRAKIFLDAEGKPTFSNEDLDVRKHDSQQVVSLESTEPKYVLCNHLQTRARMNIMILSEGVMDWHLVIRTVLPPDALSGKTKTFEENVKKYLDKVTVANKEVCMPTDSEMPGKPGEYCLGFWRKCRRRSYSYKGDDEEKFTITISEEHKMDVTRSGQKESKTDILLRCDEWNRLLTSGKWEPEQVVEKLPQFMKFVRDVHINISEPRDYK